MCEPQLTAEHGMASNSSHAVQCTAHCCAWTAQCLLCFLDAWWGHDWAGAAPCACWICICRMICCSSSVTHSPTCELS